MSENEVSIEQLLAQAREKEASVQRDREQKAATTKQTIVSTQVEKLYADREDQVRRQEEIEKDPIIAENIRARIRGSEAEIATLTQRKTEANEKIADEHTPDDVKHIYQQILEQAVTKEEELNARIKQAREEMDAAYKSTWQNERAIETTTKEAQEIMGYDKNDFPKVREFVPNKDFERIAEYVEKMRLIKAEAKEVLAKYNIDKLVETIWEQIKSGSYSNQKNRNGGGSWIYHEFEYDIDLSKYNLGSKDLERKLLANPLAVQKVIDKLFIKVQETLAQSKDHEDKLSHEGHYAAHSEVNVLDQDEKGKSKKVKIWSGVGFGDNPHAYSTDASRLPSLPYGIELSADQQGKINQAVENPNIPLQELKMDLGIKYEPETVARIQADALKENAEVDRQRELKKLEGKIEGLARDIKNLEESMARSQQSLIILEKNFQYSKTETESTQQGNEVHSLKQELERAKREIANLPKGIFGGVKDKEKQRSLSQRISEIDKLLPEKEKISNATKDRLEQIRQELGKDFHQDYYDSGHQLKDLRLRLEWQQKQLDEYKAQLGDLQKQHSALENK